MSKRPMPERLEIIELCIKAVRKELEDDFAYSGALDYLDRAADDLDSARQILEEECS